MQVGGARNGGNVGVVQLQRGVLFVQLFDVAVFTITLGVIYTYCILIMFLPTTDIYVDPVENCTINIQLTETLKLLMRRWMDALWRK